MQKLMESIPWDRLSETAIITIVSIIVIYFVFKKYIEYKNKEIDARVSKIESETKVELQQVKNEVSQIKKNIVHDSDIEVKEGTQIEENEISNSTIKVN